MSKKLLVAALLLGAGGACYAVLMPGPKTEPGQEAPAPATADLSRVQDRFAAFEQRLEKLEKSEAKSLQELRVAELQAEVTALKKELAQLKSARAAAPQTPALAKPAAATKAGSANPEELRKEVLAAVKKDIDSAVEEKTKEMARKLRRRRGPGGGEVELDELTTTLKLDAPQRRAVENAAREAQRKARFIMETPMDDGTRLVDVLTNAMAMQRAGRPEAGGQFMKFFGSLQKEVPGTGRTYGAMLREVSENSMKEIRQELGPEQIKELEDMRLDPQRIQGISDSPWADMDTMVQAQMEKLKAGENGQGS